MTSMSPTARCSIRQGARCPPSSPHRQEAHSNRPVLFRKRQQKAIFRESYMGMLMVKCPQTGHAIPTGIATAGSLLNCTVTPFDGSDFGPPTAIQVTIPGGAPASVMLQITHTPPRQISLRWPVAQYEFHFESTTTPAVSSSWSAAADTRVANGIDTVITRPVGSMPLYFRLSWP